MNYISKFAEWAGNGDHFLGFARIGGIFLVIVIAIVIVVLVG